LSLTASSLAAGRPRTSTTLTPPCWPPDANSRPGAWPPAHALPCFRSARGAFKDVDHGRGAHRWARPRRCSRRRGGSRGGQAGSSVAPSDRCPASHPSRGRTAGRWPARAQTAYPARPASLRIDGARRSLNQNALFGLFHGQALHHGYSNLLRSRAAPCRQADPVRQTALRALRRPVSRLRPSQCCCDHTLAVACPPFTTSRNGSCSVRSPCLTTPLAASPSAYLTISRPSSFGDTVGCRCSLALMLPSTPSASGAPSGAAPNAGISIVVRRLNRRQPCTPVRGVRSMLFVPATQVRVVVCYVVDYTFNFIHVAK